MVRLSVVGFAAIAILGGASGRPPSAPQFYTNQAEIRAPLVGARPYLNVLIRFADTRAVTPQPASYYDTLLGSQVGGLDHYFQEASYGKLTLAGSQTLDWIDLDKPKSSYLMKNHLGRMSWDGWTLMRDAWPIVESKINLSRFFGVNFFTNVSDEMTATQWTLWFPLRAGVRALPVTLINPHAANNQIVGHEIGHNLGFDHTSLRHERVEEGKPSPWSPMGDAGSKGIGAGTIGYHRLQAGWVAPERVYTALSGTSRTIRIERLSQPATATDFLLARIPIRGSVMSYYLVEARKRVGYDAEGRIPGEGIVIHHVDESRYNLAPAPPIFERAAQVVPAPQGDGGSKPWWSVGEVFTDDTAGVTIRVTEEDMTGYKVAITVRQYPGCVPGVVTNGNDSGPGSLREAIHYANGNPGTVIRVAPPSGSASVRDGVLRVTLSRPLPSIIADRTVIDGPPQQALGGSSNPAGPALFLDGSSLKAGGGLSLHAANCVVRRLAIGNFPYWGVAVRGRAAMNNVIEGCYVGLDPGGRVAAPNKSFGVVVDEGATSTMIRQNVVSGNKSVGILVTAHWMINNRPVPGLGTAGCTIIGNIVGTDASGQVGVPNENTGIALLGGVRACSVGSRELGNLISGNIGSGVLMMDVGTTGNQVIGNRIGFTRDGAQTLRNKDAPINQHSGAAGNTITSNHSSP